MGGGVRRPSLVTITLVIGMLVLAGVLAMGTVEMSSSWKPWVWAVAVLLGVAGVVIEVRRHRRGRQQNPRAFSTYNQVTGTVHGSVNQTETMIQVETISGPVTVIDQSSSVIPGALVESANQLAAAVGIQWQREEERRRVNDPFPLPVRWHNAPETVMDHWANIYRAPAGTTPEPLDLTGQLDRIVEVYQRIPSRRLVILGQAGAGKTILALRAVLDLLDTRTSTDPVPVIFSLGSWDPTTTSLRDWLTNQLARDYPGLAARGPTEEEGNLAAALVSAGHILPVLDGFDEIADGLHRDALTALNAVSMPLLLTSRPEEYAIAVAAVDVLTAAAGIELDDITLTDLAHYLPRTTRKTTGSGTTTVWEPVLTHIRDHPTSPAATNLTTVLSTPLMIGLARTIYSDTPEHNPSVLLDTHRFATPEALEDHLLGTFIPAAYRRQPGDRRHWDPDRVQHWLGYLAEHLDRLDTRDLAWWQLANTVPKPIRILMLGFLFGLLGLFLSQFGFVLIFGIVYGYERVSLIEVGFRFGLLVGLMFVFTVGVRSAFGSQSPEPSGLRLPTRSRATQILREIAFGFWLGIVQQPQNPLLGPSPSDISRHSFDIRVAVSPSKVLITERKIKILHSLGGYIGIVVISGLLSWFSDWFWNLIFGDSRGVDWIVNWLTFGVIVGFPGMLTIVFSDSAWGWWLVLSRVWLPLTGRLPWAVMGFLEDAYERGVLRQAGAVYQFRHARLQDHLTSVYRQRRQAVLNKEPDHDKHTGDHHG